MTTTLLAQYPQASGATDDPDQDGMSNEAEMLAGTNPTDGLSLLTMEGAPRLADLPPADQLALGEGQHAVYIRTVPGKSYGIQSTETMGGPWRTEAVVSATTTQKRLIFNKPTPQGFFRVILAQ